MKILKRILIGLVALVVLVLIIALFMPKEFSLEKQVTINKPKAEVFNYLKLLKNQDNFSVWVKMDSNMVKSYTGTDGTVGFTSHWEGKKMGTGEQEIKNIADGQRIDYELRFIKPWKATNPAYIITESAGDNQTTVKWGFSSKMDYPMNLMIPMMKGGLGEQFQTGLNNLKAILEK